MSVPEMVLRILARFPKLLVAIVKRCSSTTLHLLQDIFSFRNASVLRSRERKHFAKGNIENNSPLTTPSNDREKDAEVKVGSSVRSTTILCSSDNGSGPGNRIHTTNTSGGLSGLLMVGGCPARFPPNLRPEMRCPYGVGRRVYSPCCPLE
ncbi:hypothetical protein EDD17DRAFT_730038 [Pisolithus thermaeus]|nr:hypothetical protein EDD17DRAFT_730038 [Pisolithus thermaeus]